MQKGTPSSLTGPSKGVSYVACRSFSSCSVTCSIVLNVAVSFEQILKLYVDLVIRDFPDNFCRLSALWKWSVATFSDRVACRQNPWKARFKNNQSVTSRSPSRTVKPGMRSAHDLYNKMAEGSEPKLYKEPAVRPPSCTQLEQIARSLGLDITSDQLQAYRGIMKSTIALCDQWLNNQTLNSELVNNRICTRPGGGG